MAQTVEISLRIPSLRVRREGKEELKTVAIGEASVHKHIELEAIPKAGEVLHLAVRSGETFDCEVVRSNWHDEKNMFVIACRYSKRSISAAEYEAFMDSSDWQVKALL